MLVNNASINQSYQNTLYTKQKGVATKSFELELTKQTSDNEVKKSSTPQKIETSYERKYEVLTYENTKGMTDKEVDEYFSKRTKKERDTIKYLIKVSNDFSEDDVANKVIFEEAMNKESLSDQEKFLFTMSVGLFVEGVDYPPIHLNMAWFQTKNKGIENPEAQGIYLTPNAQYNYEHRETKPYQKLSIEESNTYFSDMANITKEWMEKYRGFAEYDYYKEDYEMYQRMSENYNSFLT